MILKTKVTARCIPPLYVLPFDAFVDKTGVVDSKAMGMDLGEEELDNSTEI